MAVAVNITAPCKINLHLRVLDRRPDGFHDIESVFQLVSLADELSVSIAGPEDACEVISAGMDLPPVNTVTSAVGLFRSATGIRTGIRVEVAKRVPAGAGLGGGSSDAASALVALDRLFSAGLGREALSGMAARIGSDVPFFLSTPAAVVTGRGELISPIPPRDDLFGVLVWPGVHSPTAAAYGLVDRWREAGNERDTVWPAVSELSGWYHEPVSRWPFRNSFTGPLEKAYPLIREVRESLLANGAVFAEMSGSGSAVFGLFGDRKSAAAAHNKLSARWLQCVQFLLLASSPMQ